MNPEKHISICFIVVTVWLSIRMVPTCWTSLCVWAQYQPQVCISPTRIRLGYVSHQPKYCIRQQAPVQCMYLTKQNTAPSTKHYTHPWYESQQAEYCTKHQALPSHPWYVSHKHYQPHPQRLSHPARNNTIRGVCLEQVCSDRVKRRKMCCQDLAYLSVRIPLLHYTLAEGCALSISKIKSAQSFFGIALCKGPRSAIKIWIENDPPSPLWNFS